MPTFFVGKPYMHFPFFKRCITWWKKKTFLFVSF